MAEVVDMRMIAAAAAAAPAAAAALAEDLTGQQAADMKVAV